MNKLIMTGAVGALALSALVLAKPAMAGGKTTVFSQGTTAGTFDFTNFSGTDDLSVLASGKYLGQTGTFSFTSSFTGSPTGGKYMSTDASTTFSFEATGASSFTQIASGTGDLFFNSNNPGLAFSDLSGPQGYSFVANTFNPTTTSIGGFGTDETGSVQNAILTMNAPVPEASTVISFGALLALGGLAVLRRKSVQNAA